MTRDELCNAFKTRNLDTLQKFFPFMDINNLIWDEKFHDRMKWIEPDANIRKMIYSKLEEYQLRFKGKYCADYPARKLCVLKKCWECGHNSNGLNHKTDYEGNIIYSEYENAFMYSGKCQHCKRKISWDVTCEKGWVWNVSRKNVIDIYFNSKIFKSIDNF